MAILTLKAFVQRLQKQAAVRQAEIANKVLKGMANHDEYREECGKAKGIGMLADIAYQLMKRADLDDEDDPNLGDMPGGEES